MENEQLYTEGFNDGYILAKYEPKLLATVVKNIHPHSTYVSGILSGKGEWEIEQSKEQMNELRQLRDTTKGQERDLEK